jgi:hypothetical protein
VNIGAGACSSQRCYHLSPPNSDRSKPPDHMLERSVGGIIENQLPTIVSEACLIELSEQMSVVALFDVENEMIAQILNEPDAGTVGADGIMGEDDLQMGMLCVQLGEKAPASIELTVVLGRAGLLGDDFRNEWNHLFELRMNNGRTEHLQVVFPSELFFWRPRPENSFSDEKQPVPSMGMR